MLDVKQRSLEVAKKTFEALGYDINKLPKLEVEFIEEYARLTIIVGEHININKCSDSMSKRFDYCELDKSGKSIQMKIRFLTICRVMNSSIEEYRNVMDDIINNLQEVMKEYFDEKFKLSSNKSITIEV